MNLAKEQLPWVLIDVAGVVYALSCESVLSLSQVGKITPIPAAPPEIKGVIDFRGQIIQLIDARKILDLKPTADEIKEFCEMMDARRQDHMNWINTLQASVENKTEFTLTTDPHQCAFGKWYDSYNDKNSNLMFTVTFGRFDAPHKAIHQIGVKVKEFMSRNDYDAALDLIEKTKSTDLQQMMHLFDEIKEAFKESKRDIVLVLGDGENNIGITADEIVAIEYLQDIDQELIKDTITQTDYLLGLGKRKNDSPVFLLNDEFILEKFSKNRRP